MSLVIAETVVEQPITDVAFQEMDQIALPCLRAHGVIWRYSLLSSDRCQMICTFDAPDAASVRDSYARLGVQKRAIWAGELIQPEGTQPQPDLAERYVIKADYPASETDWNEVQQKFWQCCIQFGMTWLRSYWSLDRTHVVYELNAPDSESLQDVQRHVGIPHDHIWSAHLLKP